MPQLTLSYKGHSLTLSVMAKTTNEMLAQGEMPSRQKIRVACQQALEAQGLGANVKVSIALVGKLIRAAVASARPKRPCRRRL